ncbi:type II toxin-antitoxin system antitoxin SocA domain-containing protein [Bradyrhizobium sp. SEMIA]|uniref:type II toxin-antitoxin system antitoxin SocA domain-containing protein n=1 Tax=Bradyrhizobium sp. SEMIA TaxID=2597515 RepID=UPI003A100D24
MSHEPREYSRYRSLVYRLHGWSLATRGAPAVGEHFQAWPCGPVLASLYREFKATDRTRSKAMLARLIQRLATFGCSW